MFMPAKTPDEGEANRRWNRILSSDDFIPLEDL